jgi:exodeoxyribonuclease V gamma subunit
MASRQPGQSMEIDLQCNGVNITGWLQQVQSDGLLRWRPSLLSVAQGMQLWLEHLVYCASGGTGESRLFVRKEGEWRFPPLAQEQARRTLSAGGWLPAGDVQTAAAAARKRRRMAKSLL